MNWVVALIAYLVGGSVFTVLLYEAVKRLLRREP